MTLYPFGDKCIHGNKICYECIPIDDRARRAYDATTLATLAHGWDERMALPFMAIRLSDGTSDGQLYPDKATAARYQLHERQCAYFSFRGEPNGFATPRHAAAWLAWVTAAYDAGFRMVDPDQRRGGHDLIVPITAEQFTMQLRELGNQ